LDLKGHYENDVASEIDPTFYQRILEAFPDAVIEDPIINSPTRQLFDGEEERVSWDAPITGVDSLRDLPWEPSWLNVKPSRFGTVRSLLNTVEHAKRQDITLYGGGQFELGPGRTQIQALASLLYPGGPNDVAPGIYNEPGLPADAPIECLDISPESGIAGDGE
ncbi:MAG: hypothetical protein ABEI52_11880, partial [Halobacteriaceae archaeon]